APILLHITAESQYWRPQRSHTANVSAIPKTLANARGSAGRSKLCRRQPTADVGGSATIQIAFGQTEAVEGQSHARTGGQILASSGQMFRQIQQIGQTSGGVRLGRLRPVVLTDSADEM